MMDLGNEGGAAGAVAATGGADAGGGDEAAAAAAAAAGGGDAGGDGGAGASWLDQFSAEGGDADNPSNRDWLKAKGFKSIDDVAKSYREAEKGLRDGGRVAIPKEGAPPEEIAAFHKAIGVPENVEGYEVSPIEGHELDDGLIGKMKPIALEAGVSAAAWKKLTDGLVASQLDDLKADAARQNDEWKELTDSWGANKAEKLVEYQRGVEAAGMDRNEVAKLQQAIGSKRVGELFQKIGAGMAEDHLIGGGKGKFGITGAEAQAEINRLSADPEFAAKLTAKDPVATNRWERLNAAVAAARDAANRAAQA